MFLNSLCHFDVVSVCVKESLSLLVKQELSDKGAATIRIRITTHAPDKCGNMSAAKFQLRSLMQAGAVCKHVCL